MKILRLIDRDTYVEGIRMNYTEEWVEEVVTTHNAFKAKDFTHRLDPGANYLYMEEIATWIREHEETLLEVVEIL